jgi:hypothetical protein
VIRRLLALAALLMAIMVVGVDIGDSVPRAVAQSSPPDTLLPPDDPPPPPEQPPPPPPEPAPQPQYPPLPPDSGQGKRVVYSVEAQRVWLVEADERVSASWLVSGRKGIPKPGSYRIYSRSRWSSAGSVRMEFMMRFVKTRRQAIGFHAIPVDRRGRPIQSEDELGQPRSKGCVRQKRGDAEHLWNWAPDGTAVRVTR